MIYAYPCRSFICKSQQVLFYVHYPDGRIPTDGEAFPPFHRLWLGKTLEHPWPDATMDCEWCGEPITHLPIARLLRPCPNGVILEDGSLDVLPPRSQRVSA